MSIELAATVNNQRAIQVNNGNPASTVSIAEPSDPSYCGTLYAIVSFWTSNKADDKLERNRENQIGKTEVTLRCDSTGEYPGYGMFPSCQFTTC